MKIYSPIRSCAIYTCFAGVAWAQTALPVPDEDTQLWSDVQLTVPLKKKLDVILTGSFRLGRGLTHPVSERGAISFAYKANKFITFETGYLYVASQPSEGRKNYNSNFIFSGTIKVPIRKFTLSNRNQVERRFRNSRIDSTRYRNRLRVEYPVEMRKTKFKIFASDEVFYDSILNKWARNRFAVGANKKLNDWLTGEVYYMRQNDSRSRPGNLHIIGTRFNIGL